MNKEEQRLHKISKEKRKLIKQNLTESELNQLKTILLLKQYDR